MEVFDIITIIVYTLIVLLCIPNIIKLFHFLFSLGFNLLSVSIVGYIIVFMGIPAISDDKNYLIFGLIANTILFIIGINGFSVESEKVKKF